MKKASGPVTRQQVTCTFNLDHDWRCSAGVGWVRGARCGLVAVCSKCCAESGVPVPSRQVVFGCQRHGGTSVRAPWEDVRSGQVQRVKPLQDSF